MDICPREDIITPGICYNSSLISILDTPDNSDFEVSLSPDLNTDNEQPLFSDNDPHFSITLQDSEVCFSIPTLDFSPEDLFDETNHSTSLPTDSPGFLNEYQPLPGSDSGVLWYHEQLRAYLRNIILSALPETWTKWITSNVSGGYILMKQDIYLDHPSVIVNKTISHYHLTFIATNTWYHLCDCDVWISALASCICSLEASES